MPIRRLARLSDRAFTLVELLVVILIIGLLAAIAIPTFLNQQHKANDTEAVQALNTAYKVARSEATSNDGEFPSITRLTSAISSSEPQMSVDSVASTGAVSSTGVLYVVDASAGGNLTLAYKSKSGKVCVLSQLNRAAPVISGCTGTSASSDNEEDPDNGGGGDVTFDEAVMADTPYAYYKLDDANVASQLVDSSGNGRNLPRDSGSGNTGTVNPQQSGAVPGSQALQFASGTMRFASAAPYTGQGGSLTDNYTLEMWIKDPVGGYAAGHGAYTGGCHRGVWAGVGGSSNSVTVLRADGCGGAGGRDDMVISHTYSAWTHVVFRRQSGTSTLWVNGVQVDADSYGPNITGNSAGTGPGRFTIGGTLALSNNNYSYRGLVDNVAWYDKALSNARIEAHYAARDGV